MDKPSHIRWKNCPLDWRDRWEHVKKLITRHQKLVTVASILGLTVQGLSEYLKRSDERSRWWHAFKKRLVPMRKAARAKRWRDGRRLKVLNSLLDRSPRAWYGLPQAARDLLLANGFDPPTYDPSAAAEPMPGA